MRVSPFALICIKLFVGWDFAPDPTAEAHSSLPDNLAGLRGPTSKGERQVRGEEGLETTCLPECVPLNPPICSMHVCM